MPGWLEAAAVYRDRRMAAILCLGFSSGLPLALTGSTLSIWLAEAGVTKTTIGLFALVGLPYTVKFLWAPAIDRLRLPLLTRWLGRRRGWAILSQIALMAALFGLGATRPAEAPVMTALLALTVAFLSASQDVVIDAYRVEILEERQYGAGAAVIVLGYRIGMVASGAGALYLATAFGWPATYLVMAALVTVGIATILLNREPETPRDATADAGTLSFGDRLQVNVIAPFAEFLTRPGWLTILMFVLLYKFGDALAGAMTGPFYIEIGFSLVEIATVGNLLAIVSATIGGLIGGILVFRWGILRSLLVCGLLQMLSNLMFAVQAAVGHDVAMLALTIGIENLSGGMGTAAFVAYLSSLCNVAYTATQYALLSSLAAFGRTLLVAPSGWLADQIDWITFFILTTVAALPGLLLLLWLIRRFPPPAPTAARAMEVD
jgi:PAT family beta-lactamase induction signal transducer AmpG